MAPCRVFWSACGAPAHERARTRRPSLHQLRDGAAFVELLGRLQPMGYTYEGALLELLDGAPRKHFYHLGPQDIVVRVTRPPLDDPPEKRHLRVQPSQTWLEQRVMAAIRPCFAVLSRDEVILAEALARQLSEPCKASMKYKVYGSSDIAEYALPDATGRAPHRPTTVGFALSVPSLWEQGPRLLAAWSAGGTDTLVFARYLRKRKTGVALLKCLVESDKPLIAMVEIQRTGQPPDQTVTLDFADDWTYTPLLATYYCIPSAPDGKVPNKSA